MHIANYGAKIGRQIPEAKHWIITYKLIVQSTTI